MAAQYLEDKVKIFGISRGIFMIAIWSLLMGLTTTMIYSQLGMFLKHELHATAIKIALFDGIVEFMSNLTRIFAGTISDFIRNRKFILLIGCFFTLLIKPLFIMAHSVYSLFVAQSLDRIANGMQASPRDALIADLSNPINRGQSYGLNRSFKTIGAFAGTLIAIGILYFLPGQYRLVFFISFIPAIIAFFILLKIKENKNVSDISKINEDERNIKFQFKNPFTKKSIMSLDKSFWKLIAFIGLFELSHFSDALLSIRANDFVSPTLASSSAIFINLGQLVFAYPIGLFSDKFGKIKFIRLCICMMIISNLLMLLANTALIVFLGAFFWGGQMSAIVALFLSVVSESVDKHLRGTAVGIYYTVVGVGYLFASTIAGSIWTQFGSKYAFAYSITICVVCLLLSRYMIKEK